MYIYMCVIYIYSDYIYILTININIYACADIVCVGVSNDRQSLKECRGTCVFFSKRLGWIKQGQQLNGLRIHVGDG